LEDDGRTVETSRRARHFWRHFGRPGGCLIVDAYLPGMSGLMLLERLHEAEHPLPAIMITATAMCGRGPGDEGGRFGLHRKPVGRGELLGSVDLALERSRDSSALFCLARGSGKHLAG